MVNQKRNVKILGINFINMHVQDAVKAIAGGGYMVVPAAPALVTMPHDPYYAKALVESDMAIADSRYMTLLWFLLRGQIVKRVSGLTFLQEFLKLPELTKPGILFLVNPDEDEDLANKLYLESCGITVCSNCSYIAPIYEKNVVDEKLVEEIETLRPKYILLNIGGGKQEKLASYLMANLSYRPAIICTGAAIAFLSGKQANIPVWVDHIGLGWLWRCIDNPGRYVGRYFAALPLFMFMLRFGTSQPAPRCHKS